LYTCVQKGSESTQKPMFIPAGAAVRAMHQNLCARKIHI
jgi:hypothetical protein